MTADSPPTHIIVHPKERKSKCSVQHLRQHPHFVFTTYPRRPEFDSHRYFRLGIGGPLISEEDDSWGLLVLDGTWRFAAVMERDYLDVPVRSLPPFQTAYPRVSKLFDDPSEGLATIEAIYAAYVMLGRDTTGLLEDYYWKTEFLELNRDLISAQQSTEST